MAIDLIAKHIQRMLNERGFRVRNALASVAPSVELPATVHVMRATPQRTVGRGWERRTRGSAHLMPRTWRRVMALGRGRCCTR